MKDDDKRRYDALQALRDHAWEEFQQKSRAEWQLSIGLWAAVLASAGAVLGAENLTIRNTILALATGLVGVLGALHLRFLLWIQARLGEFRSQLQDAQERMRELLELPKIPRRPRPGPWQQASLQVQLGITVLVGLALLMVLFSRTG
jgi:hypothetical protein